MNVTSTLYIKDNGRVGSAILYGDLTVMKDHVVIHKSGAYNVHLYHLDKEFGKVIRMVSSNGLEWSMDGGKRKSIKVQLCTGDKVRFFCEDYDTHLHTAWVLMIRSQT